jgi:uncharacterized protein
MIDIDLNKVSTICRAHRVRLLCMFGSGVRDSQSARDLDFLVDFEEMPPDAHANEFFGLLEALEDLFRKPIDLVESRAVKNPYFRTELEQTKVPIYEAA